MRKMSYMFYNCINLKKLNLSSFDTQNVVKITAIFANSEHLLDSNADKFSRFDYDEMLDD